MISASNGLWQYGRGIPGLTLTTPATAHQGRQVQFTADGTGPTPLFVCTSQGRGLAMQGLVRLSGVGDSAAFIGLARANQPIIGAGSVLAIEDGIGIWKPAGSSIWRLLAAREGTTQTVDLGAVGDRQWAEFGFRADGKRAQLWAPSASGQRSIIQGVYLPDELVALVPTVAITTTTAAARSISWAALSVGQDRYE